MFAKHIIQLNRRILEEGLVVLTWGNASIIDRTNSEVYIKPSGIDVHNMMMYLLLILKVTYLEVRSLPLIYLHT